TDEPEVQRVSSAPELAERGEREKDAEELEFHKHKKNVNFGYRYSIVMGCGEFSVGRRVSEVERVKQNQRRHRWLQECRRLGDGDSNGPYDSDQDSVADGTLGDESGTDTECVEKPTRRRSRSDYNAEVFENMQDSGDGAGLEGSEQSASEEKPENPARQRWAERGRAQTSLEIGPKATYSKTQSNKLCSGTAVWGFLALGFGVLHLWLGHKCWARCELNLERRAVRRAL
ncbi:unnamed protein product, partial [Cladocopium goreaui]